MTKNDITAAFYKAIEDSVVQEKAGIDRRQLYEIRAKRAYKTPAAQLEILWKAGLLKLTDGPTNKTTGK